MKFVRVSALLLKYFYISKNRLDRFFDIFYWPLVDVMLYGFITLFISGISDYSLVSMLLGGVILFVFVWRGSQDISLFVLEDFWSKNVYNLFTTPVKVSELMTSVIIFGLVRSIASFLLMVGFGALIYSFNLFNMNFLLLALFISLLVMTGWAVGLSITAIIFRYGSRLQVFVWSFSWLLQPFSCVFYPYSALPGWAQKIAILLPPTHVFENFRATMAGNPISWPGLIYSFVALIVMMVLGSIFLAKSIEKARKTGLLVRQE